MAKKQIVFSLLVLILMMTACSVAEKNVDGNEKGQIVHFEIETRPELKPVADEVMMVQADAIFLGRVDWVGHTVWSDNQAQHQMAVTVLQPIVDDVNLGSGGILTVAGPSPVDNDDAPSTAAMQLDNLARHNLEKGDEIIFFVQQVRVQQEGHSQLVLTPFSDMTHSVLSPELLNALILQVGQQRPLLT